MSTPCGPFAKPWRPAQLMLEGLPTVFYRTRRLQTTENGATTLFRYDGGDSFHELDAGLGSLKVEFVRGSGMGGGIGSILYSLRGVTNEFFSYNAVGHTVALTLNDGTAEKTDFYEAFGNIASTAGAAENNRLANTKERSFSIGLDNHGFRYYDPEVGCYLTRDPIGYGDGMNVYVYVGDNPINRIDPLGLSFVDDLGESLHSPDRWYNQFSGVVHSAANGLMRAADNSTPNLPASAQSAFRALESANPFSLRSQVAAAEHILTFPSRISEIGSGSAEFRINPTPKNALGVLTKDILPAVEALAPVVAPMLSRTSAAETGLIEKGGQIESAAANSGGHLVRFGKGPETAEQLAEQAAKAEAAGFPHGVSTRLKDRVAGSDKALRSAPKSEVEEAFEVQQTGKDPRHHTVVLPKPVTGDVADKFNKTFPPKTGD